MLAQLVYLYTHFVSVMVRYTQLIVGVVGRVWKIVRGLLMLFFAHCNCTSNKDYQFWCNVSALSGFSEHFDLCTHLICVRS